MSTVDERPAAQADEPEEPTNRPDVTYRLREWLSRPYVRHIIIIFIVLTLAVIPAAWLVIHFMNLSGAPASSSTRPRSTATRDVSMAPGCTPVWTGFVPV